MIPPVSTPTAPVAEPAVEDKPSEAAVSADDLPDRIWIAWEEQRRTLNLSGRMRARLRLCLDERRGWLRYPLSISKTVALLARQQGRTVIVQNPSMVLAALACLLKRTLGYTLVVDRHSNFGFLAPSGKAGLKRRLSDLLSGYTLRHADLTVVTNQELRAIVEEAGGRAFVLPDPFPELPLMLRKPSPNGLAAGRRPMEILFVSSWAFDEPIAETIEACRRMKGEAVVRITGRMKPEYARMVAEAPENFIATGFLSDADYFDLMARSDAVMAVTRRAATLVCGGYEAAVLGKPLILGDSQALREYFHAGAVHTDGTAEDLERQIRLLISDLPNYAEGIRRFHAQRAEEWEGKLADLESTIRELR